MSNGMNLNAPMLRAAANMAIAFPENWDQEDWCRTKEQQEWAGDKVETTTFCGSTFCLTGWAALLAGYVKPSKKLTKLGREWKAERGLGVGYGDERNVFMNEEWDMLGRQLFGFTSYSDVANRLFHWGVNREGVTPQDLAEYIKLETGVDVAPPIDSDRLRAGVNIPLLRAVVAMIEAYPENWDQGAWCRLKDDQDDAPTTLCGTQFCVAGWTLVLVGLVNHKGQVTKNGRSFFKKELKRDDLPDWIKGHIQIALLENSLTDSLWPYYAEQLLGVPERVFGGSYARTVWELKELLTHDTGVTF